MAELKTAPDERAAARTQSSGIPGFGSTVAAHMADDIDTLLAEVERLRGHVKALLGIGWLHRSCRGVLGVLNGTGFNTSECNCKAGQIRKAALTALETK